MLQALVLRPVNPAPDMMPDAAILRHHPHVINATGLHAGQNAKHNVGPVGYLQCRRIRNHPTDVARRNRIGYDADDASHVIPAIVVVQTFRQAVYQIKCKFTFLSFQED